MCESVCVSVCVLPQGFERELGQWWCHALHVNLFNRNVMLSLC